MRGAAAPVAVVAAILLMLPLGAEAQSIYGMNYIGELIHPGNARQQGLGFSAVAAPDTSNAVTSNPSSTADLNMVTLTVHQQLGVSRIYFLDYVSRQTRYQLPSFMVSFPIRKGLVMTLGYRTRYFGKADFSYQREIEDSPTAWENYKLDSSLYTLPVILAWKPFNALRIAGEAQFNLGSTTDKVNVWFDDLDYINVDSKRQRNYSGISWGASMLWEVHPRLWLGCNIDGAVDYEVDEKIDNTVASLDSAAKYDYRLPLAWDVGLAANVYGRWWITSSYWMRKASYPVGFEHLAGSIGDETHFGLGVERRLGDEGHALSRIPIRMGFYTDNWHLEFPPGQQVKATFFTLGSAIPLGGATGSIDYTFEFGQIGSREVNFVEEKVFRLGLSISVAEPWSRRNTERH